MILRHSVSILLLTALLGQAQPAANTARSAVISDARMRSLFQGMGVNFTESPSGDSIAFAFQLNGHTVTLLNRVKSMQLSACFEGQVDPMKQNQWNQQHYFTRVQLDQHGCPALESNVSFAGGVTNEMIAEFIREFSTGVTIYAKFITEPPSPISTMAWSQLGQHTKPTAPWQDAPKSDAGLLQIDRNVSLKYDPDQWKQTGRHSEGEFALTHSSGNGLALVIAERTAVPLHAIADIALANAQSADPNAKIVVRDKRRVNGVALYFLKIEANVDTVPMVYCGYFYAGENGTVQVVTYSAKTLFPDYEKNFMEFLNGLMVSK